MVVVSAFARLPSEGKGLLKGAKLNKRNYIKEESYKNTVLITMEKNLENTEQEAEYQEHTNGSNPVLKAAQTQLKLFPAGSSKSTLFTSISNEGLNATAGSDTDTKEDLPSAVDQLKNAPKELNKWETLMITIPDKKQDRRTVLLNMRGKKHKIRVAHFGAHPDTRLGRLLKATAIEEILELCDHFFPGQPPEYYFDR